MTVLIKCTICKKSLECIFIHKFGKYDDGICKKCHRETPYQKTLRKKVLMSPQNYLFCLNCDHTFYKWKSTYYKTGHKTECPNCESNEVFPYSLDGSEDNLKVSN